ncbi:nuclear pore complex protein NUP1-like [Zingiber officinale]|nr:nuclear pore complex protein NUP1-like [Zingiber officinale]
MAEYKGGSGAIGGKIRRHYFRRTTPYDRPLPLARPVRDQQAAERDNGWLSKLLDPASRAIAWSASLLFPSVFQKRLEAPPSTPPEKKQGSKEEVLEYCRTNSLPAKQELFPSHEKNAVSCLNAGCAQDGTHSSCIDGEFYQLLTKKTYTRSEFDRITQILCLRVTEPSTPEMTIIEDKEMRNAPDKIDNQNLCVIDPTVQPTLSAEKKNKAIATAEAGSARSLHGNDATQAVLLAVSKEEVASPIEIAKGYMNLRPSKLSPTSLSMQTQDFLLAKTFPSGSSYAKQSFDKSLALRPAVQVLQSLEAPPYSFTDSNLRSAVNKMSHSPYFKPHPVASREVSNPLEITSHNHTRLKLHGRSAIYKMARSPYFNPHLVANSRSGVDGCGGPLANIDIARSGRQMLKRGSSVLNDGIGSVGPIRRTRHKSNIMSPPRSSFSSTLQFPSSSTYADASSVPSGQKLLHWSEEKKNDKEPQNVESRVSPFVPIPLQSSEMARKILEQLDKLAPSPKVKPSNLKTDMDESPLMLTHDALSSQALKSMEKIESTKFVNVQGSGSFEPSNHSHHQRNPFYEKQYEAAENASPASDTMKFERAVIEVKPSVSAINFTVSEAATMSAKRKPSFRMSIPEGLDELDDRDDSVKNSSGLTLIAKGKSELLSDIKTTQIAETGWGVAKKYSSTSVPVSTTILDTNILNAPNVSCNGNINGVHFLASPSPNSSSVLSAIPTSAMPPVQPALREEVSSPTTKVGLVAYSSGSPSAVVGSNDPQFLASDENRKSISSSSDFDKVVKTVNSLGDATPILSLTSSGVSSTSKLTDDTALTNEYMKPSVFTSSNFATPSTSIALSSTVSASSVPFSVFTNMRSSSSPLCASTSSNGLLRFGASLQPNGASSLFSNSSQSISCAVSAGFSFASQPVETSSVVSNPLSSTSGGAIQESASSASLFGFSSALTKPLDASSGLALPTFTGSSSNSGSSTTFMTTLSFGSNSGFSSLSSFTLSSEGVGSGRSLASTAPLSTAPFGSSSVFPFVTGKSSDAGSSDTIASNSGFSLSTANASSQSTCSSNFLSSTAPFGSSGVPILPRVTCSTNFSANAASFGSNSQASKSSVSIPTFGSISSSPATGVLITSSPSESLPFSFAASSMPAFSFGSTGSTSSLSASVAQPVFGTPNQLAALNSSPGNDKMSVEDSMADDPIQPSTSLGRFGQQTNIPSPPNFIFGSPAAPGGQPFQFGSQQNDIVPPPSPFQPAPNLDFSAGSSFSQGTGGGDKSDRKFVKVRRDEHRKK